MAFHVACPITCRRICFCSLGFANSSDGKEGFLSEVEKLEEFLKDPRLVRARESETVTVAVPKVVVQVVAPPAAVAVAVAEEDEMVSAQNKRAAMQRKAAKDYVKRMETGGGDVVEGIVKDIGGEDQVLSNVKVMCRLCFNGESEGSEKARKMLSCKSCGKKYHRGCLKAWAQNRDLFHWSSWTCPSCRTCEVCRRSGDPNKFMFCKRCDGVYHCYCQQPPHKNVSNGPYVCPKHTKCHSCGSNVPGNGLSVRWFLGYTCCDACGRLFVKGNYCPVCLKVYRDSEATPMVCCDICQRWVHCQCDGISDEKYMQFQVDNNLQYKCATCRGECYQIRDLEDAVQELWRRKDSCDHDLIANLRAAAGLPTREEIFSISPFSDDEESGPIASKSEYGRTLKFSLKGLADNSPKKGKAFGKKSSNKKFSKKKGNKKLMFSSEAQLTGYSTGDNNDEDLNPHRSAEPDIYPYPIAGSLTEGLCSVDQAVVVKHKSIDEVSAINENRSSKTVQLKTSTPQAVDVMETGKHVSKSRSTTGPKLVIHLGTRNRNPSSPPRSDASSYPKEQDLVTSNGSEDVGQKRLNGRYIDRHDSTAALVDVKVDKMDNPDQVKGLKFRGRGANLIKIKKLNPEASDTNPKFGGGKLSDGHGTVSPGKTRGSLGKQSTEGSITTFGTVAEVPGRREKVPSLRYAEARPEVYTGVNDNKQTASVSHLLPKDPKPLLKLKFKNPFNESNSSWSPHGEDEKSSIKGQRSKRKRPSSLREKMSAKEEEYASEGYEDNSMDGVMEANWILQNLGKDAIDKRVEVHQPSNNSWHKGQVTEVFEETSALVVALDSGRTETLDLAKQGIHFDSKKQKR